MALPALPQWYRGPRREDTESSLFHLSPCDDGESEVLARGRLCHWWRCGAREDGDRRGCERGRSWWRGHAYAYVRPRRLPRGGREGRHSHVPRGGPASQLAEEGPRTLTPAGPAGPRP